MKKRILQLIGSFHQGGSERQAVGLLKRLRDDGRFQVYAATLDKTGVLGDDLADAGIRDVPEFPLTSFVDLNFLRQTREFRRFLGENRIDLVHSHDFYTNVFGAAGCAFGRRAEHLSSKRETFGMRTPLQRRVEAIAFRMSKGVVANSNAVRDLVREAGIADEKIHVIHNGVDQQRFTACDEGDRQTACELLGLPYFEGIEYVVLVANLRHEVKNVPMLLRVAKRLKPLHPNLHFVIAGEGDLMPDLRSLGAELGVSDNTHFLGRSTDVPSLLNVAMIGVLTSNAEGFANAILEYMAAGKPVVATRVGGADEAIFDGVTGFLVEADDDRTMAARIRELLEDPFRAAEMGRAGQEKVMRDYSEEEQFERTCALYGRILGL